MPITICARVLSIGIPWIDACLVGLSLIAAGVLPAADVTTDSDATAAEDQLKQLNDRTIIGSYISLDTEWDQFKHGTERATWTATG